MRKLAPEQNAIQTGQNVTEKGRVTMAQKSGIF